MNPDGLDSNLRIAVVCLLTSAPTVRRLISLQHPGWETRGEIVLVEIRDQWRDILPAVAAEIEKAVPRSAGFVQILVLDKIKYPDTFGIEGDDLRRVIRLAATGEFQKKLPEILRGVGLDWLTLAERELFRWHHGTVDKARITLWLRQFAQAGSNEWIGRGLLRALNFWSEDRLISSVALTREVLETFERVCMHREQAGKSADVLSNLFTKRIKPFAPKFAGIEDFRAVIADPANKGGRILFLEDGLFSGTETINLFRDLLGLDIPQGRNRKTQPLEDKSVIASRDITLLFPVATSFGVARVKDFLEQNNLTNINVTSCAGGLLEVLTPAGTEAMKNGTILDPEIRNCPADPDGHFLRPPFEAQFIWKNSEDAGRALVFCKEIGVQLFRQYLQDAGYTDWHPQKIERCALGMYGLGLAFAFTHSIPKASLPLFWASGKIFYQNKIINWVPLFPNA